MIETLYNANRFVFNLKRILVKVGLGVDLNSFANLCHLVLIKEDKTYEQHKNKKQTVITYLKEENLYKTCC